MGNRIWSKTYGIVHGAELRSIRQIPLRTHATEKTLLTARGEGELLIMAYTGRLRAPERGIFFRFQVNERWGLHYN